jgi:nicotinate-nucleotide adenylyltransferase
VKLGIFGGTFDPVHLGHVQAAANARACLGLESVLFVPAGQPPHRSAPLGSALERYAMVCLATAKQAHFVASPLELERPGPSYMVDTLEQVRTLWPGHELVLLVGADMIGDVHTWRRAARLIELCQLAVLPRPGETVPAPMLPGARIAHVQGPALNISATVVRARARAGQSLRGFVSDEVAEHIDKRRLYR